MLLLISGAGGDLLVSYLGAGASVQPGAVEGVGGGRDNRDPGDRGH